MKNRIAACAAAMISVLTPMPATAWSPDDLVPIEFSYTLDVGFGNSIFVLGPDEELGESAVVRSRKLVYTPGAVWKATIGVPPGSTVSYRYYNRTDGPTTIGNPGNGTTLGTEQTTTTPAHSGAPASKGLLYLTGWSAPVLHVESAPSTFANYQMTVNGPGRGPGEQRWEAAGFGQPGRKVRFYLSDGGAQTDYAPGGGLYETYLDAVWLQDGGLYNYQPAPSVSASRIETILNVASPQGLQSRTLRVYLPRGYDDHPGRSYPVLYMHDGQNIYGTTGGGFPPVRWNVDGTLNRLVALAQVRETIVVGIDNTSDRISEYTPPGAPAGGISGGQGNVYRDYVTSTVKALIDANYRTLPGPQHTGTAGSSLGGIISTYFGLERPDVFTRIGALSPAYWVNLNVVNRLTTDPTLPAWRHYMDSGNAGTSFDGYANCFDARDRMLLRGQVLNRDVFHMVGIGEEHNEQAWQNRFPVTARYLFPAEDEPNEVFALLGSSARDWPLYE